MTSTADAEQKKQRTARQVAARRKAIRERLQSSSFGNRKAPVATKLDRQPKGHAEKIAAFHTIEKRLSNPDLKPEERSRLLEEQNQLGGLQSYQEASLVGAKYGESSKWFVQEMEKRHGRRKVKLLDVGAIAGTSYKKYKSIQPTYIDLNPQAEHVIKADFLEFPVPDEDDLYDAVCLSLVVNFVGDLSKRTEMLSRASYFLKPDGYLYLVLPLACVQNSRYIDHERLTGILRSIGWEVEAQHDSALLTHWVLRKGSPDSKKWPRKEVRGGVKRNNFVLIVK